LSVQKINLTLPINQTSYGYVSQNIIKALINLGVEVHINPIGELQPDEYFIPYLEKCHNKFTDAPHLIIFHHFALKQYVLAGHLNVGFPIFETDEFDGNELENFNSVDKIIVACDWYKKILESNKNIYKGVSVAPLGFDPEVFTASPNVISDDGIVHYLHIGKWEIRKNQLGIFKAFGEEFKDQKDVELTLVSNNPFIGVDNEKWKDLAKSYISSTQLNIFPGRISSCSGVASLIRTSNIGLSISRAEGFDLPYLEMLASNRPMIGSNWSGHAQFASPTNSYLVESNSGTDRMFDGQFFNGAGNWMKWTDNEHQQLKKQLRQSYEDAKNGNLREVASTVQQFTWENTAKQILETIK
jgi:glycosyltransferase involved in cell wall biosynthesis